MNQAFLPSAPQADIKRLISSFPDLTLEDNALPGDKVHDSKIPADVSLRRAEERYPVYSTVIPNHPGTLRAAFTQSVQEDFKRTLGQRDPRILAKLEQPFGKENLRQVFRSEAALRHVLLPLWKSGYMLGQTADWSSLAVAYYPAAVLGDLLDDYGDVEFNGARGYDLSWKTRTAVDQDRVAMTTAALLHFNGCVADLVRWIGGPHVAAHRDHPRILATLKEYGVPQGTIETLRRVFLDGIPAFCNADSTEDNFLAYYRYGNHSTVEEEPEKTFQALLKDYRKGYTLLFDPRAVLFMIHCHLTPQGVVDLNTPYKNPRPIFDSSFRPYPWCHAINDWTDKDNEPELTFSSAELDFMVWLYNLRISYPSEEIYIADDDISGAFRLMKYHPNCMAMHTSMQSGYCVVNTGGTFGDNTSPSNFDPIGLARRQLAQRMWVSDLSIVSRMREHLPQLRFAEPPSPDVVSTFRVADKDTVNTGVLTDDGERMPPPYNMHVDDNLYADVRDKLEHTIAVSVASLFEVLGDPTNPLVPTPLSAEKFEAFYNHRRKLVGRLFDSRALTVGMLPYKRDQLRDLLTSWVSRTSYELLDIASLLGILENHTRYARWARCWYFSLQNAARRALFQRHKIISRIYARSGKEEGFLRSLPKGLHHRLHNLIAQDKAQLLWHTRQKFTVDTAMRQAIGHLLSYLDETASPWEVPLGLIVPRDPHFSSRGDASHSGGGAYCDQLEFWFDIAWSPKTIHGVKYIKPGQPGFVHINFLEFIVVILQLAAVRVRLTTSTADQLLRFFPNGVPDIPVWYGETDNTVSKSWENRATARSPQAQGLVSVYAELLRTSNVHTQCEHLAGELNKVADDISRNDFSRPLPFRADQLYLKHPSLRHYSYFQPSPELLQLLTSRLYSAPSPVPSVLPKRLGHFVPADSITSTSVVL